MRIAVVGIWHLGAVYAACLAKLGHEVIGIDEDSSTIDALAAGTAPLFETGLDTLLSEGLHTGALAFSTDLALVAAADVVWLTADTVVGEDDSADVAAVVLLAQRALAVTRPSAVFIVSSQVPAGTMARLSLWLQTNHPDSAVDLAYVPENLRLGSAIDCFFGQQSWTVGTDSETVREVVASALRRDLADVVAMSPESAEFVKHALNSFLAVSVAFANEIGRIALSSGADPDAVMRAVMSDPRVGQHAYLRPGPPIEGGTLARDVVFLNDRARELDVAAPILGSLLPSNADHVRFILEAVLAATGGTGLVGVAGLGYKQGSSSLRRSFGLELCAGLSSAGLEVEVQDDHLDVTDAQRLSLTAVAEPEELFDVCDVVVWNRRPAPAIERLSRFGARGGTLINVHDLTTVAAIAVRGDALSRGTS